MSGVALGTASMWTDPSVIACVVIGFLGGGGLTINLLGFRTEMREERENALRALADLGGD